MNSAHNGGMDRQLVVHGHFYQPPRENPWTEVVAAEPSAAPAHDWNERITAECYRPNGWARIVDDRGRVVAIVDNYAHLSFNVGPTLLSWLEVHDPDVLARMVEGDRLGGGAIAQAYNHMILPLASERDVRTQVRWGLADFRYRFGREAEGIWLPETAVNDDVLRVLAEEGVGFTILAPNQALAVRPPGEPWHDVSDGSIDGR
ncbi:MAG: putative glycoside hydrolase family 57, partial [Actinomycetia bacterium]|nr:putative glycoside hydrolase family 57 [Actinomycetes bacterium]